MRRLLNAAASFVMSAVVMLAVMANATAEESHPLRFSALLLVLLGVHLLLVPRLKFHREYLCYLAFLGYMTVSLIWTADVDVGGATVGMAGNFMLLVLLFGALATYYPLRAVLCGLLAGFGFGALRYALTTRFPLAYPEGFSYNTMAGLYLFGLILTALFGWYTRKRLVPALIGTILLLHIIATTSIKTNLGVLLGVFVAGLVYFRSSLRLLLRGAIPLLILAGIATYTVLSTPALLERLEAGFSRVGVGVALLTAREDVNDNIGLGTRQDWQRQGLKGWVKNPVFGYGVEAFRHDVGITSHSTVIDVLYNSGLIGAALFGSMFLSLAARLVKTRDIRLKGLRVILIAAVVCYSFMLLSAAMYFDTFLAGFIALAAAILDRQTKALAADAPRSAAPSGPPNAESSVLAPPWTAPSSELR